MKLMVVSSQGIEMDQTGRGKAWCEYPDRPGCCPAMCTSQQPVQPSSQLISTSESSLESETEEQKGEGILAAFQIKSYMCTQMYLHAQMAEPCPM